MNFSNINELDYICKLLFNTYKIPIAFIDNNGNLVVEHTLNELPHPYSPAKMDLLRQLMAEDDYYSFPIFKTTASLENYFHIQLPLHGSILVGPVLYSKLRDGSINGLIYDLHLKVNKEEMIQYYQTLPVLSNVNFINMSMVLYYMLYQHQLDVVEILQKNKQLENQKIEIEQPDVEIAERRQNKKVHQDPMTEKKFFDCIREGETAKVINALKDIGETGVLSKKSYLRSQKNLGIAGITLATRAALDGGLFPEIAYTLSDLFIQNLEELNDSKEVDNLMEKAFLEFSQRVEQSIRDKYSPPIYACQNYIFTHIYEEITLNQLAVIAAMNPSYLSALFKKEVGVAISGYIQRAKIIEAKRLMTYTAHSLTEISSLLNFHDQSYFTKIFKKYAGVTPKQFKSRLGAANH